MKTVGKVLITFLLIGAVAAAAVFYLTGDMIEPVDAFFAAAAEEDYDAAYERLSTQARASTPKDQLIDFIGRYHFDQYESAFWNSRSIEGGVGTLKGTVTTGSGTVPVTLTLVREGGVWMILAFKMVTPGVEVAGPAGVPEARETAALVNEVMVAFGESVNARSMAGFHGFISPLWRQETTPESLDEVFGEFFDIGGDLTVLGRMTPEFDPAPRIDADGILHLEGSYPTRPSRVDFEMAFLPEGGAQGGDWKLISLGVFTRDVEEPDSTP